MSQIVDDLVNFKSLVRLSLAFLSGREKLRNLKLNEHKHLIGTVFPPVEFAFAVGAYPVFPIRMQSLGNQKLLNLMNKTGGVFGWDTLTKGMGLFKKIDNQNILTDLVEGVFSQYMAEYNRFRDITDPLGIPSDSCYGIRAIYGMNAEKGKNLSANLNFSIRCSSFEKLYESTRKFVKNGLMANVPLRGTPKGKEMLVADLYDISDELEKITGRPVSNNSLQKVCITTNQCKDYSSKIIHDIALGDTYPCSPVTISEFLLLIEMSFMDYLSDADLFLEILKEIYKEMSDHKRNTEFAVDVSKIPKILFVPRFGGSDPLAHKYASEIGGRIIYADWEILGYFSRIKTTGDMFENYADYLINTISGFGVNNEENTSHIADFAVNNGIDGVIYNQLFGCHSLTSSYRDLRKKLMKEEIPSTLITFNKIGENQEQLKTRIEALMELLR